MKRIPTFASLFLAIAIGWPAFAGVVFTSVTKTVPERGRAQEARMRGMAEGENMRIEFLEGGRGQAQQGDYMLARGDGTIYLVDPDDESYMSVDADQMSQLMGSMGKVVEMDIDNVSVETLVDERGPRMNGYPTRHVKLKTSYDMSIGVMGIKRTRNVAREEELWLAQGVELPAVDVWRKQATAMMGSEELEELVEAERGKWKGFPLKTITVTTTTDRRGSTDTQRTEMVVESLEETNVAASRFELPEGYRDVTPDLSGAMDRQPAGGSSGQNGGRKMPDIGGILQKLGE